MRILLIAPQPFYTQRGTPIAVRLLAEEIGRQGHDVDLLTYWEGEDVDIPRVTIIRARKIPGIRNIPIGFSVRKLLADFSLFLSFLRLAGARRYDVVHAVEESVYFAAPLRWLHRAKVIYDMDSSLAQQMSKHFESMKILHPLFRVMENWAIRRSDRIVAVCEDLAISARQFSDPVNVFVLNDIVPLEASSESSMDQLGEFAGPDEVLALYVGNFESYQGVDLLVDAAELLPTDIGLRILIIGGSESDINRFQSVINARSLEGRIALLGPRPLAQLMAYLEQADILLSPRSSGNNTPLKIYCYMSAGKPIIATEIVSHTQVLTKELAMLVPPSAVAIAEALKTLATNPQLRDELGAKVRSEAQSHYTLATFRSTLLSAYSGLKK